MVFKANRPVFSGGRKRNGVDHVPVAGICKIIHQRRLGAVHIVKSKCNFIHNRPYIVAILVGQRDDLRYLQLTGSNGSRLICAEYIHPG